MHRLVLELFELLDLFIILAAGVVFCLIFFGRGVKRGGRGHRNPLGGRVNGWVGIGGLGARRRRDAQGEGAGQTHKNSASIQVRKLHINYRRTYVKVEKACPARGLSKNLSESQGDEIPAVRRARGGPR